MKKGFLNHWSPGFIFFYGVKNRAPKFLFWEFGSEAHPNIFTECRFPEKSFNRWYKQKILADEFFPNTKINLCRDNDTYQNIRKGGQSNIRLSENIKYANTPLKTNKRNKFI
ncbi:MAG: hypothetical protein CM15mP111_3720 [Hyphomicrobiales bacterium]|nr:MAG: hypothetical protein CM15mP111_3720 [Hyphomicrobiales bacterium]